MRQSDNIKINDFIKSIRESFDSSVAVYSFGNCYQFYEILKIIYPDAEAYYDGNHVWTKIDNRFFDIYGERDSSIFNSIKLIKVEGDLEIGLSVNKMGDEDRTKKYGSRRYNKTYLDWNWIDN